MTEAYVIGAGQSSYGAFPDETYRSLFEVAIRKAIESVDAPFDKSQIEEGFLGTLGVGGRQIGLSAPAVTEHVGLHGIPVTRIENACAASGYAFRNAVMMVRAGLVDVALAGGYEMMNDMSSNQTRWWLGVSGEMEWERLVGTTFSGTFGMMASAHMAEYGTTREDLARVAVKNHRNASSNPDAHLQFECTVEDALDSPMVAEPLTLYDCCPRTDGASAVIVASEEVAREVNDTLIRAVGTGAASDHLGIFQRETITGLPATKTAAERAYDDAGITPSDVDIAEVHDCFTIAELIAYEDLGFCELGESATLLENGATEPTGSLPVNTSGGLKAKGHPIGATGTGQITEIIKQFRGEASVQIDGPEIGLAHNVGGSGAGVTVNILEKTEATR